MRDTHREVKRFALPLCWAAMAGLALVLGLPESTQAAGSAPTLAVTGASAFETGSGARGITLQGTFNYDDLLQFSFPAGLIVSHGASFTRYDLSSNVTSGTSALVADGVTDLDVVPLLAIGGPSAAPAQILKLRPGEISVLVPDDFAPGAASIVLYGVVNDDEGPGPGTAFVSNAVEVALP